MLSLIETAVVALKVIRKSFFTKFQEASCFKSLMYCSSSLQVYGEKSTSARILQRVIILIEPKISKDLG